jgi:hypothetical protein
LHLDRYCIPFFLLKVWYALERFRLKLNFHANRRETNKMAELYWMHVAKKYGEMYLLQTEIFGTILCFQSTHIARYWFKITLISLQNDS